MPTMPSGGKWRKSILLPTWLRCGIAVMLISILPVAILFFALLTFGRPMCRIFFICKPLSRMRLAAWLHSHRSRLSVGWQTWVSMFFCSFPFSFGRYGSATARHCWWRSLACGQRRCCGWLPPTESSAMCFPFFGIFRSLLPSFSQNPLAPRHRHNTVMKPSCAVCKRCDCQTFVKCPFCRCHMAVR